MRLVFDLDETLCIHSNRDYANARPVHAAIQRIVELKHANPECEVVIHTARGMKSCEGDVARADAKNRAVTEDWLKRNGVPYDELVFGKPFADAYIDDKAVTLDEWIRLGASTMRGFSGTPLAAVGRIVVKSDPDGRQRDWYAAFSRTGILSVKAPDVISWSFGRLFLRRVEGETISQLGSRDAERVLTAAYCAIREMGSVRDGRVNDVGAYAELVGARAKSVGLDSLDIMPEIHAHGLVFHKSRSFCHGDFSTTNLIASRDGLYIVDPSDTGQPQFSTYLLDAAKMRASLNGLEEILTASTRKPGYDQLLAYWDRLWTASELCAIKVLERTHYIRIAAKANALGRDAERDALLELEARNAT